MKLSTKNCFLNKELSPDNKFVQKSVGVCSFIYNYNNQLLLSNDSLRLQQNQVEVQAYSDIVKFLISFFQYFW